MAEGAAAAGSAIPKAVLFVDDDDIVLEGLRDALRSHRRQWSMSFVTNGDAALAQLERGMHDVIVSDLRMPGMDGATLLEAVRDRHPDVVRIVLSGHADIPTAARAAGAAHRMIAKPCETHELARVIERSCALRDLASRIEIDRRAIGASALPSVPRLHRELTALLADGRAGAADAAHIVGRDMAMSAKVLQLANSAYFGRRTAVTSVSEAVAYLGLEALRALVLQAEVFRSFPIASGIPGFDLETLHRHCGRVARLAAAIATETDNPKDAFTAGLLHDVGLLVLAAQDPIGLAAVLATARERGEALHHVERERHGVTHADLGAHLLALWGLPPSVTEAVAGHNDQGWLDVPFDGVAVVYVANILVEELEAKAGALPASDLDLDYLERAGLRPRLGAWRELAARQFSESGSETSIEKRNRQP